MGLPAIFLAAISLLVADANAQVTTGQLGDAAKNLNNPAGAAYRGVAKENKMGIKGSVTAVSAGDKGTEFAIEFSNLPTTGGPFLYHIHVAPVPEDGNCTSTLAHLDPYIRGEDTPCVPDRPETCQVGDLSGKHGKPANVTSFSASYTDPYVSLQEGVGAFFGNRSFVIHFANKTRIACGNFQALSVGSGNSTKPSGSATLIPLSSLAAMSTLTEPAAAKSSTLSAALSSSTLSNGAIGAITTTLMPTGSPSTTSSQSLAAASSTTTGASPAQVTSNAGVPARGAVGTSLALGLLAGLLIAS